MHGNEFNRPPEARGKTMGAHGRSRRFTEIIKGMMKALSINFTRQ